MNKWLNYFHPLSRLARARKAYLLAHPTMPEQLQQLLQEPLPDLYAPVEDLVYFSVDIETSGLDAKVDHILSVGYVTMQGKTIDLSSVDHTFIKGVVRPETAVINHIMPQMVREARKLDDVMMHMFEQMQGKLLLVHAKQVEQQFVDHYVYKRFGLPPMPLLWLDTLAIEKSMSANRQHQQDGDYRLASIRQRYGLPEYHGHSASVDAIATAELFMALSVKLFGHSKGVFKAVFKP
ncbi:exonuclease domain-containing protein [Shewanella intestini]|uniref:3'-5' exonuclease n=1 Tax=Shewanella intestini TaxID=2017544 RepID=A0ABS5I4H7_9GAMM|nr:MULTISPECIES: 3'-5' exonuclease [Shewanella]MBR9728921.1 3'-5' exonuclease [Shewanella intestini]MRG37013.1 3'-5' exonuclease [Shewanella sp. XMDDZSB0408]